MVIHFFICRTQAKNVSILPQLGKQLSCSDILKLLLEYEPLSSKMMVFCLNENMLPKSRVLKFCLPGDRLLKLRGSCEYDFIHWWNHNLMSVWEVIEKHHDVQLCHRRRSLSVTMDIMGQSFLSLNYSSQVFVMAKKKSPLKHDWIHSWVTCNKD